MKILFFSSLLIVISSISTFSQQKISKWGKLSEKEIKLDEVVFEKQADAVILGEFADIAFFKGEVYTRFHFKIKILSQNGLGYADVSIPYNPEGDQDAIGKINAQTLNIVNGKIIPTKLTSSDIYTKDISATHREKVFTFKNVKVGSVIEYRYSKKSKSVRQLEYWYFQNELPTILSICTADIPEGINYKPIYNGTRTQKKYLDKETNVWELTNLPSLRKEDFVFNHQKYAEGISFQLEGYMQLMDAMSNETKQVQTMTTWEQLRSEIVNSEKFSTYIAKRKISSKIVADLKIEQDTIRTIFNYVQNKFKHSNLYGIFPERPLGKLINESDLPADADEINLFLNSLLKNSGIEAYPMLISTRSNGDIMKSYPLLSQFNHLIVYAKHNDREYFLDASSAASSFDLLPIDCLSPEGYIVDKNYSQWKNIKQFSISKKKVKIKIRQDTEESWNYNYEVFLEGYEAKKYMASEKKQFSDLLVNFEFNDVVVEKEYTTKTGGSAVSISVNFDIDQENSPIIYLATDPLSAFPKNPFKYERRDFPIELDYPFLYEKTISLTIPDNLQLKELPQQLNKSIPKNCGSLKTTITKRGQHVKSDLQFRLPNKTIPQFFFTRIKQIYQLMLNASEEVLVLEKL